MNKVHSEYVRADELIEKFCKNKITDSERPKFEERYIALWTDMNAFIEANDFEKKVVINEMSLAYMLVDYFEDVRRLKEYHEVKHINAIKIVAYTSYWFLRRQPLQLVSNDKSIVYVNERFILAYILNFLDASDECTILDRTEQTVQSYINLLFYYLKYRVNNPNAIEMILASFITGRVYQDAGKEKGLEERLGRFE